MILPKILFLSKEGGQSSNSLVSTIRRELESYYRTNTGYKTKIKVGHGGTLDQFASGLMILATHSATRLLGQVLNHSIKEYEFDLYFGYSTNTLDSTGIWNGQASHIPSYEEILNIIPSFIGYQKQMPPIYSALKIAGKRASDLARNGENVILAERDVTIYDLTINEYNMHKDFAIGRFYVKSSSGFYVRALGRDIANSLNSCGHLTYLHRISIENHIPQYSLDEAVNIIQAGQYESSFHSMESLVSNEKNAIILPQNDERVAKFCFGQTIICNRNFELKLESNTELELVTQMTIPVFEENRLLGFGSIKHSLAQNEYCEIRGVCVLG